MLKVLILICIAVSCFTSLGEAEGYDIRKQQQRDADKAYENRQQRQRDDKKAHERRQQQQRDDEKTSEKRQQREKDDKKVYENRQQQQREDRKAYEKRQLSGRKRKKDMKECQGRMKSGPGVLTMVDPRRSNSRQSMPTSILIMSAWMPRRKRTAPRKAIKEGFTDEADMPNDFNW